MKSDESAKCPLCNRKVKDTLKHFSLIHELKDADQFKEKLEEANRVRRRRAEFDKFVEDLKKQEASGRISAEDYRKLIIEWEKRRLGGGT